jgi:hypothetical protein
MKKGNCNPNLFFCPQLLFGYRAYDWARAAGQRMGNEVNTLLGLFLLLKANWKSLYTNSAENQEE